VCIVCIAFYNGCEMFYCSVQRDQNQNQNHAFQDHCQDQELTFQDRDQYHDVQDQDRTFHDQDHDQDSHIRSQDGLVTKTVVLKPRHWQLLSQELREREKRRGYSHILITYSHSLFIFELYILFFYC